MAYNLYGWSFVVLAALAASYPPQTPTAAKSTPTMFSLKVTGEDGRPVPGAEAVVRKKSTRYLPTLKWQRAGAEGDVKVSLDATPEESDGSYEALVRAPGYKSETAEITLQTSATLIPIKITTGSQVSIKLAAQEGHAIPTDLTPAVFPEQWGRDVWLSLMEEKKNIYVPETLLSPLAVTRTGAGVYSVQIDEASTEPLYLLINHPDFLRAFQAGPFAPADWVSSGTVEVALPKPASIVGVFEVGSEKIETPVVTMELGRTQKVPGQNNWGLRLITKELPATSATLTATDLAPGKYSIDVTAAPKEFRHSSNAHSTEQSTELDAAESQTLTLAYKPFKKEWLQGPYAARIKIMDQKNQPAAGKPYKVTWYERGYPQQTVSEGVVPENGVITLENIAGVKKEMTREEAQAPGASPSFDVEVASQRLGSIYFYDYRNDKFYPLADGKKTKVFEFNVPPAEGDPAPDFAMVDLKTSKTVNLADFKDQVVMIDFWATWCGPCQGPMAENQEIMRKHAADWKGKAVILAVSIDDEMDTVLKHLDKNDWHETQNTWAAPDPNDPDKSGWQAPAAKLYGINSIPTMVLIDSNGIIKKRGHMQDVEKEMLSLLDK